MDERGPGPTAWASCTEPSPLEAPRGGLTPCRSPLSTLPSSSPPACRDNQAYVKTTCSFDSHQLIIDPIKPKSSIVPPQSVCRSSEWEREEPFLFSCQSTLAFHPQLPWPGVVGHENRERELTLGRMEEFHSPASEKGNHIGQGTQGVNVDKLELYSPAGRAREREKDGQGRRERQKEEGPKKSKRAGQG